MPFTTNFEDELKDLVRERIEAITDQVSKGGGIEDYSKYKYYVGVLEGLRLIDELLSVASKNVNDR